MSCFNDEAPPFAGDYFDPNDCTELLRVLNLRLLRARKPLIGPPVTENLLKRKVESPLEGGPEIKRIKMDEALKEKTKGNGRESQMENN